MKTIHGTAFFPGKDKIVFLNTFYNLSTTLSIRTTKKRIKTKEIGAAG